MHTTKHLWEFFDRVEQSGDSRKKFLTETDTLLFVPPVGTSQVLSHPCGGRPRVGASASSSLCEHSFSGNNIARIALVFSEALVDHPAMSVAKRHVGRLRSKALPDQLRQAQPRLGRELQDFINIGVAHDSKLTTVASTALTSC